MLLQKGRISKFAALLVLRDAATLSLSERWDSLGMEQGVLPWETSVYHIVLARQEDRS